MPPRRERLPLAQFIGEIKISAALEAQARECGFTVPEVDPALAVDVDAELLSSAVGNLLQNGFKYTQPRSDVVLTARASGDRVLIEVEDHCGGLHPGDAERLLAPLPHAPGERARIGLGLSICQRSVAANDGMLSVRSRPGSGCIFTIDLPASPLADGTTAM
jgi:signal transduction histidine kinase